MKAMQRKPKDTLKFLDFRSAVGHAITAQAEWESAEEDEEWSPPIRRASLQPKNAKENAAKHLQRSF